MWLLHPDVLGITTSGMTLLLSFLQVDPAVGLAGEGPLTWEEEELEEELRLQIVGRWVPCHIQPYVVTL